MRVTKKYVDHPAPSAVKVAILLFVIVGGIATLSGPWDGSQGTATALFWVVIGLTLAITAFAAAHWQKGMFATRIGWPSVRE